jgi:hypothetical protein
MTSLRLEEYGEARRSSPLCPAAAGQGTREASEDTMRRRGGRRGEARGRLGSGTRRGMRMAWASEEARKTATEG